MMQTTTEPNNELSNIFACGEQSTKLMNFCIGSDSVTGRVKWFPDSKFIKYCLLLPIIMLMIVFLVIIVMQINLLDSLEYGTVNDDIDQVKSRDCKSFRHIVGESMDIHEKEIFRDIRTSFVPPASIVVPVNCGDRYLDEGISGDNERLFSNSLPLDQSFKYDRPLESRKFGSKPYSRFRRDVPKRNRTKSTKTPTPHSSFNEKSFEIPAVLKSFWKGGKTPEEIRSTQVEIMKQYMDTSVKPCDDFYQYACGNWEKLNPIPKDKAAYDTFEMLREILDIELNTLLSEKDEDCLDTGMDTKPVFKLFDVRNSIEAIKATAENLKKKNLKRRSVEPTKSSDRCRETSSAEQKAKYLFQSCMKTDILQKRGVDPLLQLIKVLGGWPVLEGPKWQEENFDWIQLAGILRLYNNDVFIMEWVGPDIKNSEENVIQLDQTSLGLPTRDYFLQSTNADYLQAYQEYAKNIMTLLGAEEDDSAKISESIVRFEVKLASITATPEERVNVSLLYHRMTVEELHQQVPNIDWHRYLEIVLERPVNKTEAVVMFAMKFMQDLVILLKETDTRTIANYMFWKFVRHRINNLDDRFQVPKQKFYNVLIGREKSPSRWKTCVNQVNSNMGMAVGAMFVRRYFDEKSKQDTMAMTHELQDAFREILNETDWIDSPTKSLAEMKVNGMSLKIGYPDFILDSEELDNRYKDLEINPDQYFENILNVLLYLTRTEQSKLGEAVNRTNWNTAPAVVNAYYSRNKNQIMFPAGILQPPFYHRHLPRSLNFGGIGVVIGHELTHGFDDKGRLFDRDGNLNRWWSDRSVDSFHNRANCLIFQYGNYTISEIGGLPIDGTITQGENIADNGGIKQAFRAYERWLGDCCQTPECLEQERMPELNVTNKQLFFLNFAQVWCGAMRPEATKNKMKTAVHSPGRFRVIGTLSNSKEFAREFGCAPGTPMNPENKCSVW